MIIAIIAIVAYTGFASKSSPLPSVGATNFSLKITNTSNGIAFVGVGTSGKKSVPVGQTSPTLHVTQGNAITIHIISEVHGEKYGFVIPELDVHSKQLGFFEADTVTFVAEKKGEFTYTSTGHPEIKGLLVVIIFIKSSIAKSYIMKLNVFV